ncbi:MAG: hypothetical protein DRP01_04680, partial [Archaeoglobales archaeon]
MSQILNIEELTPEIIKNLMEIANKHERKFFLVLTRGRRPGEAYHYRMDFEIIYGKADVFEIEHIYDYPTTDDHVCVIVPRSIPVVIRWYHEWDYGEDQGY